jgi:hypothetical protein
MAISATIPDHARLLENRDKGFHNHNFIHASPPHYWIRNDQMRSVYKWQEQFRNPIDVTKISHAASDA